MQSDLQAHSASFKAGDANNWITLITGIAQLFIMIAPILAQLFGGASPTPPPAP
jgi:hypothetical protein